MNFEKIIVKTEKMENMEKNLVIFEKIIVMIRVIGVWMDGKYLRSCKMHETFSSFNKYGIGISLLHIEKYFCDYLGEWVIVNIDLEDQPRTVDSGEIYNDFKTAQATPPVLLKELNTQVIIQASKLLTEGSLVYDRAEPFGGLIGYQSAVIVPILKMAKSDPTGIDEQLSIIAAMSVDNQAIAQMAFTPYSRPTGGVGRNPSFAM